MPLDLAALADPATTAVITMEVQRGVCGDLATMPALSDAVAAQGILGSIATLLSDARAAGVPIIHCTFSMVPDRAVSPLNTPLLQRLAKNPDHLLHGTAAAEVCPELGVADSDRYSDRHHGMSPFIGTDLDPTLRGLGVSTVVVTGVSLNLGIMGAVIEAVNFGYRVIVVRDCVVGVPVEYGEQILTNTLPVVATIVTSAALAAAWTAA
jgi:nicotinamidase-related amidase